MPTDAQRAVVHAVGGTDDTLCGLLAVGFGPRKDQLVCLWIETRSFETHWQASSNRCPGCVAVLDRQKIEASAEYQQRQHALALATARRMKSDPTWLALYAVASTAGDYRVAEISVDDFAEHVAIATTATASTVVYDRNLITFLEPYAAWLKANLLQQERARIAAALRAEADRACSDTSGVAAEALHAVVREAFETAVALCLQEPKT
ncbi:MAG: hypothetical protein ACHREM_00275 [Polyangiales bacterium]